VAAIMTAGAKQAGWLVLPLIVAGLVVIDPWVMRLLSLRGADIAGLPYATPGCALVIWLGLFGLWRLARQGMDFAKVSLALIFVASQLNGIGAGPADIFDGALFGILAVWIVTHALDTARPLRLSVLFFLATGLVVLTLAHMPLMSPVTWFIGLFGIARVAIIVLLVVDLCRDARTLDAALRMFVATAVVSAVVGIVQFALAYLGVFYFTLITPAISAFKPTPIGFVMRASGLCITAQHFSSFLVYALPFALWRLADTWRWRDAMVIAIILAGLAVSLNFGAMFAAMLVIGLMPFLRWPHLGIHLGLALVGLLSVAYFVGGLDLIYDLTFGDAGIAKGVDQRKTLFILGLEQFGRNPLIGTGLHGFGAVDGNFWDRPVHNLFGQAAVELGLGGLLIVLAIFFILTLDLVRLAPVSGMARVCLLMLAAAIMLGQSEPNLDQSNLWIVLALAQATILIGRRVTGLPPPLP
jgi:hypothetical protein